MKWVLEVWLLCKQHDERVHYGHLGDTVAYSGPNCSLYLVL